jgi:protoheme IX farnesyltransferase
MLLVVFTALTGMIIAPGHVDLPVAFMSIICITLGAGSAGALNMWYDRDIDAIMTRTKKRPIPAGVISEQNALEFALVVATLSVFLMLLTVGYTAALLLLFTIVFYAVIYTMWLKRRTVQNIVIGGIAGSVPPIIGYVTVTGSIDIESIALFLIIFFWTPPHFWSLSLLASQEYRKAGIPMLPVVKGNKITKIYIIIYTLLLTLATLLPIYLGMFGKIYLFSVVLLNILSIKHAFLVYKEETPGIKSRKMFKFSIIYLFVLFGIMIIDRIIYAPI